MLDLNFKKNQESTNNTAIKTESPAVDKGAGLKMPAITSLEGSNQTKTMAIFVILAALMFIGLFVYLFVTKSMQTSQLANAQAKLTQLNLEITSSDLKAIEDQDLRFKNGFPSYNSFIAKSFPWSVFFGDLEKLMPKNIIINNISYSDDGNLIMSGETGDYDSVGKFLTSLTDSKKFIDPKITSINKSTTLNNQNTIKFEINTKINQDKFKSKETK